MHGGLSWNIWYLWINRIGPVNSPTTWFRWVNTGDPLFKPIRDLDYSKFYQGYIGKLASLLYEDNWQVPWWGWTISPILVGSLDMVMICQGLKVIAQVLITGIQPAVIILTVEFVGL